MLSYLWTIVLTTLLWGIVGWLGSCEHEADFAMVLTILGIILTIFLGIFMLGGAIL